MHLASTNTVTNTGDGFVENSGAGGGPGVCLGVSGSGMYKPRPSAGVLQRHLAIRYRNSLMPSICFPQAQSLTHYARVIRMRCKSMIAIGGLLQLDFNSSLAITLGKFWLQHCHEP